MFVRFLGIKNCFYDILSSLVSHLCAYVLGFWVLNVVVMTYYQVLLAVFVHMC